MDPCNIRFRPEPRERIYCGNQEVLPPGYSRFGTRYECLRKGYGAALLAPEYKRAEARVRFAQQGYRRLTLQELAVLASQLGIDPMLPNGDRKSPLQLLNEIIPIIRAMAM